MPYAAFRPEFTDVMDEVSRGLFDGQLLDGILPLAGDLPDRLAAGAPGGRRRLRHRARRQRAGPGLPRLPFIGYDIAADAIERARAEAAGWGLTNASFEVCDAARLPTDPPFAAVFAFDAIHDQADPAGVLRRIHDALEPGGVFAMLDIKAASALEDNSATRWRPGCTASARCTA